MTQIQIQGWNFRIDELAPQDQITIAQLVNHLAAHKTQVIIKNTLWKDSE